MEVPRRFSEHNARQQEVLGLTCACFQVPDEDLVDRVAGRRLDPETGDIYHMKHKPPPEDIKDRLIQRSDDTAEKVQTRLQNHHKNVDAVLKYYQDVLVEVRQCNITQPSSCSLAYGTAIVFVPSLVVLVASGLIPKSSRQGALLCCMIMDAAMFIECCC